MDIEKIKYFVWAVAVLGLQACAGRAIDLDRGPDLAGGGAPEAIDAIDFPNPVDLVDADETRVFWIDGPLQSCEYDDCAATKVSYGPALSDTVTLGTDDVYFQLDLPNTPTPRLFRCPKGGCAGGPRELLRDRPYTNQPRPQSAVDETYFYWSSSFDIYRCSVEACEDVPEVVAENETSNTGLIVNGDDAFWTTALNGEWDNDLLIRSAPKNGSRPPRTVGGPVGVSQFVNFAVDTNRVYWLDEVSHVQSCPRAGCDGQQPLTLVATPGAKANLRVDATRLYWLESADVVGNWARRSGALVDHISIRSCPINGCAEGSEPDVLTQSNVGGGFAMNSRYLYWTQQDGAGEITKQIFRRAKP